MWIATCSDAEVEDEEESDEESSDESVVESEEESEVALDSDEEEGLDWDELEEQADRDDKERSFSDDEETRAKRKRAEGGGGGGKKARRWKPCNTVLGGLCHGHSIHVSTISKVSLDFAALIACKAFHYLLLSFIRQANWITLYESWTKASACKYCLSWRQHHSPKLTLKEKKVQTISQEAKGTAQNNEGEP